METEKGEATWYGSDPFYNHLKILWDKEAEHRLLINTSSDFISVLQSMENWYEILDIIYSRILIFLTEDEINAFDNIIQEVEEITKGQQFCDANLDSKQLYKLRKTLKEMANKEFYIMGKNNLLVPRSIKRSPGESWKYG